jgi:hypothetical protein
MNLEIAPESVTHVLIEDGWHTIKPGTFEMARFAFATDKWFQHDATILNDVGVTWVEGDGSRITCRLQAVRSVRQKSADDLTS